MWLWTMNREGSWRKQPSHCNALSRNLSRCTEENTENFHFLKAVSQTKTCRNRNENISNSHAEICDHILTLGNEENVVLCAFISTWNYRILISHHTWIFSASRRKLMNNKTYNKYVDLHLFIVRKNAQLK